LSSYATKAGAPYLTTLFVGRCGKSHCFPPAILGISIDLRGINVKVRELPTSPHKSVVRYGAPALVAGEDEKDLQTQPDFTRRAIPSIKSEHYSSKQTVYSLIWTARAENSPGRSLGLITGNRRSPAEPALSLSNGDGWRRAGKTALQGSRL